MRYSDSKIFRFDFVSLYCLIYKIAQDMNAGNTVFAQLMSLIPDYELRKCIIQKNHENNRNCIKKIQNSLHAYIKSTKTPLYKGFFSISNLHKAYIKPT